MQKKAKNAKAENAAAERNPCFSRHRRITVKISHEIRRSAADQMKTRRIPFSEKSAAEKGIYRSVPQSAPASEQKNGFPMFLFAASAGDGELSVSHASPQRIIGTAGKKQGKIYPPSKAESDIFI